MVTIVPASASDGHTLRAIDDDACALFAAHGVEVELPHDHPFAREELARWLHSAEHGSVFLAVDRAGAAVGFTALELVDGEPYLDQLSVRVAAMRQGIGGELLARAADWARSVGGSALWLTTYAHLSFNQPYYERHGFVVVRESECSAGLRNHLDEQRRILPAPGQRVAMRLPL